MKYYVARKSKSVLKEHHPVPIWNLVMPPCSSKREAFDRAEDLCGPGAAYMVLKEEITEHPEDEASYFLGVFPPNVRPPRLAYYEGGLPWKGSFRDACGLQLQARHTIILKEVKTK